MHHLHFAFGLPHGSEWLYILIGIIILFGADKLPKLARGLGKSMGEFKKAKEDFEREVSAAAAEPDVKPQTDQNRIGGNLPAPVTPTPVSPSPFNTPGPFDKTISVDETTKKS
jgi:sec-independent protein translocase protein TatA